MNQISRNMAQIELVTPSMIILPDVWQWRDGTRVIAWLRSRGVVAPDAVELVNGYASVCLSYGVNWLWAIAQAAKETGFWQFGGDVRREQNNFAGLGATGGGEPGESFRTVLQGIVAHIQHLALYAGIPVARSALLSERDKGIYSKLLGRAQGARFENLTNTWATDPEYFDGIMRLVLEAENFSGASAPAPAPVPAPEPDHRALSGVSIGLSAGHALAAQGAHGRGSNPPMEWAMNVVQVKTAMPVLQGAGATVKFWDPNPDNLRKVGDWGADFKVFVDFHHNAANADGRDEGSELWLTVGASTRTVLIANIILAEICKELGTFNRGIKYKDWTTISRARDGGCEHPMLVESYFIDDYSSIATTTDRSTRAAKAFCRGLIKAAHLI